MIAAGRGGVGLGLSVCLLKGEAYGGLTTLPQRLHAQEYVGGQHKFDSFVS